jgi:hypothetical protein
MAPQPRTPGGQAPGPAGLVVIGRKEYVDLPEWGLWGVRVKVDTGAYSSSLDVASFELVGEGAEVRARVWLALDRRNPGRLTVVEAPVRGLVRVRPTSGECQQRPLLETLMRLGPVTRPIRVTVSDRAGMRNRILLGRQALAGAFLVDVGRKYVLGRRKKRTA